MWLSFPTAVVDRVVGENEGESGKEEVEDQRGCIQNASARVGQMSLCGKKVKELSGNELVPPNDGDEA